MAKLLIIWDKRRKRILFEFFSDIYSGKIEENLGLESKKKFFSIFCDISSGKIEEGLGLKSKEIFF